MIIDSDYETLTISDKDGIKIRNLNDYNILKYGDFEGNRIIVKLSDHCSVTETFDEGIFNVIYGKISMQIRDHINLSKRIRFCMEFKTDSAIKELMLNEKREEYNKNYLLSVLSSYNDKVKFTDKIIINDMFAVDPNGQAYFIINGIFHKLCIVVNKNISLDMKSINELGELDIDFKTKEIICKVMFLLFPDLSDSVFMKQLPKEVIQKL